MWTALLASSSSLGPPIDAHELFNSKLVLEMKAWPSLNPKCSANSSPFDSPLLHRRTLGKMHITPACATPKQPMVQLCETKSRYCECCKTHFTDMKMVSYTGCGIILYYKIDFWAAQYKLVLYHPYLNMYYIYIYIYII